MIINSMIISAHLNVSSITLIIALIIYSPFYLFLNYLIYWGFGVFGLLGYCGFKIQR